MGLRILLGYDKGPTKPKLPRFHSPMGGGKLYYGGVPSVVLYYHRRLPTDWGYGSGRPIGKHLRRLRLPPLHGGGYSGLVLDHQRRLSGPPRKHKWPDWVVKGLEGRG